jgi:hypothetical protein
MTKITVVLFIVIFVLNLLPAFAPPTWTAMSFIGLTIPSIDFVSLAVVAANCGHLRAHYLGKVVARDRAAEIAEQRDTAQRRRYKAGYRRSASNDI